VHAHFPTRFWNSESSPHQHQQTLSTNTTHRATRGMYCPNERSNNPVVLHDRQREKSASTQYATWTWARKEISEQFDYSNWKMLTLLFSIRRAEEPSCRSWGHSPCSEPMKANFQRLQIPLFQFTNWESQSAIMVKTSVLVSSLLISLHLRSNSDSICDLERCAQCHQQRREVWKETSPDPTIFEGHRQVPQRHAEARYVGEGIHFYTFGMITRWRSQLNTTIVL
jgi:hypothetical protein